MPALRSWNQAAFGCLTAQNSRVTSRARTTLTASMPTPTVSRKADTSACVELEFGIDVTNAGWAAWQQWTSFDLLDCSLPFTIFIPWGEAQPQVRARLLGGWSARRVDSMRWQIGGLMEIERSSLPALSGGAYV